MKHPGTPRIAARLRIGAVLSLAVLAGSTLAADMTPVSLSGFNRDLVIENTASGPPYSSYAVELNPGENLAFYQAGLPGKSFGLPVSGSFLSAMGDGTTFQFAPYTSSNALVLNSGTGLTSGTLTLVAPAQYHRIAIAAHSASGGGTASLTLNFLDGTSFVSTYYAPDWFNNSSFALQGVERINLSNGNTSGAPSNPRFYQTTLNLSALLGVSNKPLASITFNKVNSAGSTGIYAVSGEPAPPAPAVILASPTNTSAVELGAVTFSASVGGNPTPSIQWLRNGAPISGATNPTYTLNPVALSNHNAGFRISASNFVNGVSHVVQSDTATLSVTADISSPVLLGAGSLGLSQVQVRFSERLALPGGTQLSNYSLTGTNGTVTILNAIQEADGTNVLLTVSPLTDRAPYVLAVNNVTDRAAAANPIAPGSQAGFIATAYSSANIGDATPAGLQIATPDGWNLSGGGADLGGTNDQFHFSHVQRTGDFDVRVRIDALTTADAWSEAGMIARETLEPGSRFAAVLATPSISGCYFQARTAPNAAAGISGSFPVNYPHLWLRLKRAGNDFTGYAGFDGSHWTQLGSATLALPPTLHFGFAVSSHSTDQVATAGFRDFSDATDAGTSDPLPFEKPGASSGRTSLVISEIMYHPTNTLLEFVELFNTRGEPHDLSGYTLQGSVEFEFPPGTLLPAGGFLVVARSPSDLGSAYGLSGVLGPFTNNLPNSSGEVLLVNQAGGVMLQVEYSDDPPWPAAADGAGHSLVLARPSYGESSPRAWAASDSVGGSPGRLDPFTPDPLRALRINEFLAHTDDPEIDFVELYNHSTQTLDLSGCVLSDDAELAKFVVPQGTTIPPRGFVAFNQNTLGFALSAEGETLFLKNPGSTRVLDSVRFGGQENGVSSGRVPDGSDQIYRLASKTPGTNNAPLSVSQVVINELMYHPISRDDDEQFVELFNRGATPVNLGGWTLSDGISFTFPSNTVIAANGYLVVARNVVRLLQAHPALNPSLVIGNFGGRLSHGGERIALNMPDEVLNTVGSVTTTNIIAIAMDEVTYGTGGAWPEWADGGGSSLELIDPRANRRMPSNWAESDETSKAPWKTLSATGTLDQGNVSADQLQVLIQGAGECLIDNVQVLVSGANRVPNSTFESNAAGWVAEGTHSQSLHETGEGHASARSFRLRAANRGDNQVNRVRAALDSAIPGGVSNVTITASVRWLKGHPELLLRLRGNWLECAGEMALPVSPGTPGARNSRYITNAPPAITDVAHFPTLPQAGEPIRVTARIQDPDGLTATTLRYRIDPDPGYSTIAMTDTGTGGDAVAEDGLVTALIPAQPGGTLVAFHVQATDSFSPTKTSTFPATAPAHECLVRVGETQPTGNLPVHRIWMTQSTLAAWTGRHRLDNTALNVTFVLGNQRAFYGAKALYAGSPYISPSYNSPTGVRCGYDVQFAKDDLFLGGDDLVLDWPGGHGNETTAIQEQMGYWIADRLNLAFSHRYTIRLHVNGVTDDARQMVFEAVQQPGKDFVEQWSAAAPEGELFKIDRAFEFNDALNLAADPQPRLENFTTTGGVKKREKYRWNFLFRGGAVRVNDYSSLYALVDALNAPGPEPYTGATTGLADVEQWMRIFATEHIIANFDSYGHEIGKNMYAYKPAGGKWQLYMFDLDWLMLAALARGGYGPGSAPLFNSEDPTISRMYAFPPFLRAYWRTAADAVNGPLAPENCNPVMDAKYRSLVANGIVWCDGQALTGPAVVKSWFSERRAFLQAQLAAVASPFTLNPGVSVTNGIATVSGTAPIGVHTILINGVPWTVRWTSVSNWTASVPLNPGSNVISAVGVDSNSQPLPGASNSVPVNFNGTLPNPAGAIVINEIMSSPALPGAEFVELFNASTNAYDLSGWELNGLSYTFPGGSLLPPRSFLLLTRDRTMFNAAYGNIPVFDAFDGNVQANGETLTLFKPGPTPTEPVVVDRVRYEATAPWPAARAGVSLQVRDPAQDNSRVANWATGEPPDSSWVYFSTNGLATSSRLYVYLTSAGTLYLDDIQLVAGTVPGVGVNLITNGGFESPLSQGWVATANFASSTLSTTIKRSGASSLHFVATAGGSGAGNALIQDLPTALTIGQPYALSFWYRATSNNAPLVMRLSGANATGVYASLTPVPAPAPFTPGTTNSVVTTLAPFPSLWLNELQADNSTGPVDNAGQREPWAELFNSGTNTVGLNAMFLSDSFTNLTRWNFPAGASIGSNAFRLVWCDNQTNQSTPDHFHAAFRLPSGSGTLFLSRIISNQVQVLDYLNYSAVPANWSYGDFPDGQPFYRRNLFFTTPGATNNPASAPITVFINEWMADNTHTLADPADNGFEDWFELYNPGPEPVNLGGYYLTDTLANPFKFQVPNNGHYILPPGGFLLVWADDEAAQNNTNRQDLHAGFALSKGGEAIGLFAADGTQIDAVTFGEQASDISQGSYPDGSAVRISMPTPTPRMPNISPNTAPVLQPISDRVITLGQTLSFTANATDSDQPQQALTFSLLPHPTTATVHPVTGQFNWTPSNAPALQAFSVVVSDSGMSSLTATQSFQVTVLLPPNLSGVRVNATQFVLSWTASTGQTCQIEFTDNLGGGVWTPVGDPVPGNGGVQNVTNDFSGVIQQRFFRARILP